MRCALARAAARRALQCGSVAAWRALQRGADVQPHYNPARLSHPATLQPRPVRAVGARPACECRGLRVCYRRDLCERGLLCVGLGLRVEPRGASGGRRGTRKRPCSGGVCAVCGLWCVCVSGGCAMCVVCVCGVCTPGVLGSGWVRGWVGRWEGGGSWCWWGGAGCEERRVSRAEAHVLLSSTGCQISAFEWCVDPRLVRARRLQGVHAGCRGCTQAAGGVRV